MEMQVFVSFFWCAVLLLQIGSHAREIDEKTLRKDVVEQKEHLYNPMLNVFFKFNDLYRGKKMPIYFSKDSNPTYLLPREEVDQIPFSSKKLSYLLEFFSISNNSPQARSMEDTLKKCEVKPKEGEFKFCVTSLESMVDMIRGIFGTVKPNVLTTKILSSNDTIFQWYTFVEKPVEIYATKIVACHAKAYPYLVYSCHGHNKGPLNKLFRIALSGEDGEGVDAIATCHMDTSSWDPNYMAFQALGGHPGGSPVCHFLPADNLVWITSS